jgi:hypothetical protein
MSRELFNRNADLKRLRDEGYYVQVVDGFLVMREAKLGISGGAARDNLGASTRLGKATETAADLNAYWRGRLTDSEKRELTQLIGKPSYVSNEREAVEFAIAHRFERNSVVDERRLYEAAIRYGIGSVTPEAVREEAIRQGVLTRDGEATTRDVLAEEARIIQFAREGRGAMTRSGRDGAGHQDTQFDLLSEEQRAICRHVWDSPDQVLLIRGAAGTGKTKTMRAAIDGIDKPVVVLAPSAEASRGVLRSVEGGGFHEADTVARFLVDETIQKKARGGILWIDEAGLLGIRQVSQVFEVAGRLGARVILQGDRRQHGSVERGAVLRVLEEFAGQQRAKGNSSKANGLAVMVLGIVTLPIPFIGLPLLFIGFVMLL